MDPDIHLALTNRFCIVFQQRIGVASRSIIVLLSMVAYAAGLLMSCESDV